MSATIDLLKSHTSVRSYTDEPVSEADRRAIFAAARMASTSCGLQITSVIRVSDPEKRRLLAEYAGHQKHVVTAPEFWIFCADYHRDRVLCPDADLGWTEQFLVGCLDTGIMAQSTMASLESLGLGGVFVGGLRNNIEKVGELLQLPEDTIPLLGLAFGHPAVRNELKPRLPAENTFMEEVYREPDPELLAAYNEEMREYYGSRSSAAKDTDWVATLKPVLLKERRPFILDYIRKMGFAKR